MTPLASTSTASAGGAATILLILAAITLGYLALCWLYPFVPCPRCAGTGRRRSPIGRAFRLCNHCDGDGRRLRPGRHVLNYLRALHDRGTR